MTRLDALLAQMGHAGSGDAHAWLVALVDALRPPQGQAPAAAAERLDRLIDRLAADPETAQRLAEHCFALFAGRRQRHLLAETGVMLEGSFAGGLVARIGRRLLPPVPEPGLWIDLLGEIFHQPSDPRWVEAAGEQRWARLVGLIARAPLALPAALAGRERLRVESLEALRRLAHRLAALGSHPELLRYHALGNDGDAPFLAQARALLDWCDALDTARGGGVIDGAEPRLHETAAREAAARLAAELDRCDAVLDDVRRLARVQGTSTALTLRLREGKLGTARIRRLVAIVQPEPPARASAEAHTAALLRELVEGACARDSVRALLAEGTDLLALQVTENASRTGEHYVTTDRAGWLAMARSAMGAGVIVGAMALAKILLAGLHLPPFWEALAFGLNYALGFVLVHALHFTIATKQPAMTAAHIAAVIDEGRDRDLGRTLERLATLTAQVSRTQLVAIAGNVLVALPTSLLIAWAWLMAAGVPVTSTDKAAHLLADLHPWASAALPHAAIAGVCLFLAGIIAGYQDNRCVYARLPARIARHPGLHRLIGPSRSALLASYVEQHHGAIIGNIAFGLMLGYVGFLGTILGLPLDIRHVTFAAANLAYGAVGLQGTVPMLELATAALGVALIGMVNLGVSFGLAFWTALKARGLRIRQARAFAAVLGARLRREPASFVFPPPREPPAAP